MTDVPSSATGQPLRRFATLCDDAFKGSLARYGFSPVRGAAGRHKLLASRVYRVGELYVRVSASTHPRDIPPRCTLVVGEGSHGFPEADWNSVALWQLMAPPGAAQLAAEPYLLVHVGQLPSLFRRMRADLEESGSDFLSGDLGRFRAIRSALAESRSPYTIWRPDQRGHYLPIDDPESAALRIRYVSEADQDATE